MAMSWLKNLGTLVNAGIGVVSVLTNPAIGIGNVIKSIYPKSEATIQNINDELPEIASAIVNIEAIGQSLQLPGPEKLKIAVPLVAQIVMKSKLMYGKIVKNTQLFMQGVAKMADGMVDILNSVAEDPTPQK